MASAGVASLRRRLEQMGRSESLEGGRRSAASGVLSFGVVKVDAVFRDGGLEAGVHHLSGEGGLTLGFGAALMGRLVTLQPRARLLLVQEADAVRENGELYAPGLKALGVDPGRIALVRTQRAEEALRIADEAARSSAFRAVTVELRKGEDRLDLGLTRRFNLAAERSGAFVLLLTPTLESTSAALTRWRIAPDPVRALTAEARRLLGRPTFAATLIRNRLGPSPASFTLEWDVHDRSFRTPAPIPAPVAVAPVRRDRAQASAGDRSIATAGPRRQAG